MKTIYKISIAACLTSIINFPSHAENSRAKNERERTPVHRGATEQANTFPTSETDKLETGSIKSPNTAEPKRSSRNDSALGVPQPKTLPDVNTRMKDADNDSPLAGEGINSQGSGAQGGAGGF